MLGNSMDCLPRAVWWTTELAYNGSSLYCLLLSVRNHHQLCQSQGKDALQAYLLDDILDRTLVDKVVDGVSQRSITPTSLKTALCGVKPSRMKGMPGNVLGPDTVDALYSVSERAESMKEIDRVIRNSTTARNLEAVAERGLRAGTEVGVMGCFGYFVTGRCVDDFKRIGEALASGSPEAILREASPLMLASYDLARTFGQDWYMSVRKINVDSNKTYFPFDKFKAWSDELVKGTVTLNRIATEASRAPKTEPVDDDEDGA